MRVLVVAAGTMAQAGMAALLESVPGIEVAAAVAPPEVALVAQQVDPDVCLVDLEGALQGGEVMADLVSSAGCPVVAVAEAEEFTSLLAAGAAGAVIPSVPAAALRSALEAAAAGVGVVYPAGALTASGPAPAEEGERHGALGGTVQPLTARELEVLRLLSDGLTNQQVARTLLVSEHTAKFHVAAVLGKLGAHSRAEAVAIAYRHGLISI
jgi:DNA-binding NarL/FixJ family response regulator